MTAVGLTGNNASEMARVFLQTCQTTGCRAEIADMVDLNENKTDNIMLIVNIHENWQPHFNILVAPEPSARLPVIAPLLTPADVIVVNADTRAIFPLLSRCQARMITFGFNAKASVTASSVTGHTMQICFQRAFLSLSGRTYEPQEFNAPNPAGINPYSVLGAVTACAVCDALSL